MFSLHFQCLPAGAAAPPAAAAASAAAPVRPHRWEQAGLAAVMDDVQPADQSTGSDDDDHIQVKEGKRKKIWCSCFGIFGGFLFCFVFLPPLPKLFRLMF